MQQCGSFVCATVSKIHLTEMVHLNAKGAEGRRATLAESASGLSSNIVVHLATESSDALHPSNARLRAIRTALCAHCAGLIN